MSTSPAERANGFGPYSAVMHNVAAGYQKPERLETEDGLPHVFAVNVLAPYGLTALIDRPERLVYLSSGLHRSVRSQLDDCCSRSAVGMEQRPTPKQALRRDARLRHCEALVGRVLQRSRARVGGHQDGRSSRNRRPEPRAPHTSLARNARRSGRSGERRVLLPSQAAGGQS